MNASALKALLDGDMSNFLVASTPGGIEAQEKEGQLSQAVKQALPLDLRGKKHEFEAVGFKFLSNDDGLFQEVEFPVGWSKSPTDHSMWTDILDEKGRKRGAIFYKAAFYDRSAHAHLSCRFHVGRDYDHAGPDEVIRVVDAMGLVVKSIDGLEKIDWSGDRQKASAAYDRQEEARNELAKWLDFEFPNWNDPTLHWS